MKIRVLFLFAIVVCAALLAVLATSMWVMNERSKLTLVEIGGPFTLTNHRGEQISDTAFRGRLMLIYFGYTYCPDVCPTELQVIGNVLDHLGDAISQITPVFITIDPERDDWETLNSYVEHFHEDLVGLTGSAEEIAAVAKAYRVYYAKSKQGGSEEYLMDHTSLIYLMDKNGRFARHFTSGTSAEDIAAGLSSAL